MTMDTTVKNLIAGRTGAFAENEVKDLLRAYEIPTTKYQVVRTEKDMEKITLQYPVALKVCSSKILHKTDVGGVVLNIQNKEELKKTFKEFRMKFPTEVLWLIRCRRKALR
jgi:acyl-CoA synthetase (NDP forming)